MTAATSSQTYVIDTFHAGVSSTDSGRRADTDDICTDAGIEDEDLGLRVTHDVGRRVAAALRRLWRSLDRTATISSRVPGGDLALCHQVRIAAFQETVGADGRPARMRSTLWATHSAVGSSTPIVVELRWVNRGARGLGTCWLNLRANPSSLMAGTNALPVDIGLAADRTRRILFRWPFHLLRAVVRDRDPGFGWDADVAAALRSGEISLHNLQVALLLPMADGGELSRFLAWLYLTYCTPWPGPDGALNLLCGRLGMRGSGRLEGGGIEGVMLRGFCGPVRRRHPSLTVNFYAKNPTLHDAELRLLRRAGGDELVGWLARTLRLDLTLHRPLLARLIRAGARAAGAEDWDPAKPTEAAVHRAIRALDDSGGGFDRWLLRAALVETLRLPSLLRFEPRDLEGIRRGLRRRRELTAVFDPWWDGGEADLGERLRARGVPRRTVLDCLRAVREAGLDPEIPPQVYRRLVGASAAWGFSDADLAAYLRARLAGDGEELVRLSNLNLDWMAKARRRMSALADRIMKPSPAPGLGILDELDGI